MQNPLCRNPIHDAFGHKTRKWFRQRHTCVFCCMDRIKSLVDVCDRYTLVKMIMREFRCYWCPFCLLDADLHNVTKKDLRAHCVKHQVMIDLWMHFHCY
jgi:hypothetical protein